MKMHITILFLLLISHSTYSRIHKLEIKDDDRKYIALSTFGFYKGGTLHVELSQFHPHSSLYQGDTFGFSLDKTLIDSMNPYLDSHQERCILDYPIEQNSNGAAVYFIMDLKNKLLKTNCTGDLKHVQIFHNSSELSSVRRSGNFANDPLFFHSRQRREVLHDTLPDIAPTQKHRCADLPLAITQTTDGIQVSTQFVLYIATDVEQGLYSLYFHNCANYKQSTIPVDFTVQIKENNVGNYLSAGEMPLPALYFMMALLFFLSGCFWVFILSKSRHLVFKIHYLMALLVYLKSLSLLFHGINFHFIQTKGEHIAAWAILYYVTHLLKGSVLFIVIVFVGTGWTFIKHILSEKDKKIFMIVIPLQVLANVAEIIIEESEEGDVEHKTWRDIFILVDLLCCGAILFPVVWSIRHLQEASHTDGKAAVNLRKLKLFRHFYIMIVCYIYFTRIIVYLLKITVPFQYEWLDEMFREMATYVFFVLTGYKFRPASANPYFQVPAEEEEDEMDIVVTETGLTEGLKKVNRIESGRDKEGAEEEKDSLMSKRESSHEYD